MLGRKQILIKGKGWVKLTLNPGIYPLSTIYSAGYTFLDKAYIYIDKESSGKLVIWIFPKDKKAKLNSLGMDFYNELLNYAHYFTSLKANADTLKILMQKALFSAAPSLVTEAATKEIDELICSLSNSDKNSNVSKKHAPLFAKTRK
ncbi:MAG: hypothetical protein M0R20_01765 [Candidatus Omnitrophica bacterium]|jgi:His-Xaa-Ser system protein HxsD|nr:hypothetical protein [Candidatus Omnitrophota bacterium]